MTTLPDTYREQIRCLIDAVHDPTVSELVFSDPGSSAPRSRRMLLIASAVVVAVLAVAVAVFATHDESSRRPTRVAPAQSTSLPESCIVTDASRDGCPMSPDAASTHLGFEARVPEGIPTGWVQERANLRVYRNPVPANDPPLPAGVDEVPIYQQTWIPPGTDLNATGTCPSMLWVRERRVLPGETAGAGETVDLGKGRVITGMIAAVSTCGSTQHLYSFATWIEDGISFTVTATDVDHDHVVDVIESLFRR